MVLLDWKGWGLRNDSIIASGTCEAILSDDLPRFFRSPTSRLRPTEQMLNYILKSNKQLDTKNLLEYRKLMSLTNDIPLRERKQSRTRLAIIDASMNLLQEKSLAKINVEEICERVEISRGAFFNYFNRKLDLIIYIIRLWSIEIGWMSAQTSREDLGLCFINRLFMRVAESMLEAPNVWAEIMSLRVLEPKIIHRLNQNIIHVVSKADRRIRYPDRPGIENIEEGTIVTHFRENLQIAVEKKELPGAVEIDAVLISLTSLLYGVPTMMAGYTDFQKLHQEYDRQLKILWAGIRTTLT